MPSLLGALGVSMNSSPRRRKSTSGSKKQRKPRTLKDGSIPEAFIQAQILSWLEASGLLHWRANSGVVFVHGRRISLGPDGISDIVVVIPPTGRFLGLEVKSANGTLREVQKQFRDIVEANGGHYKVVRSLTEAMNAVAESVGLEFWKQLQESGRIRTSFLSN